MALDEGQSEPPTLAGVDMSEPTPRDPIDELRRANPVEVDHLPTHSRARIWARIEEARMAENKPSGIPRWAMTLTGVAVVAVVAVAALQLNSGPGPAPGPTDGGGGGIGMCVATYRLDTLADRDFTFDGTVTAIDGDQVTFSVNTSFWGVGGGEVTLTASGAAEPGTVTLDGTPTFAIGERYLVAGDDVFAWGCGFTQPYDPDVAAEWAGVAN